MLTHLQIEAVLRAGGFGGKPDEILAFPRLRDRSAGSIDVGRRGKPGVDASIVPEHGEVQPMPPPAAVGTFEARLDDPILWVGQRSIASRRDTAEIVGMQQRLLAARSIRQIEHGAGECPHGPVVIEGGTVRLHDPDLVRHGIERLPQTIIARLEKTAGRHCRSSNLRGGPESKRPHHSLRRRVEPVGPGAWTEPISIGTAGEKASIRDPS